MPYVYLGFVEVLQEIFSKIFDEVLSPVITAVFNILIKLLSDYIWKLLSDIFMDGFVILLKALNFIESMFSLFSGLADVTYRNETTSLMAFLFNLNGISKALAVITVIAAIMAFLFALYSTGKAMADAPFESQSSPISHVLKNGFKSAVTFMMVPFLCTALLQLSSAVLNQTIISFDYASSGTVGGKASEAGFDNILFVTAAQKAAKNGNVLKNYNSGSKYADREQVKKDFNLEDVDFLLGYVSCIMVIIVMAGACLSFIRRLFDLLILYLVSPFFSATIALDGGARFSKWRDLFVSKFFAGFGSIFAMKIYLLAVPTFTSGKLVFSGDATVDSCIKMFLAIGGAWAVYKGQSVILQAINPEAASMEKQSSGVMAAIITGGVGRAVNGAVGLGKAVKGGYAKGQAFKGGKE